MDKHPLDRQRRLALQLGLGLGLAWALPVSAQTSKAGKPSKAVKAARQTKSGTGPAYGHQPAVQAFAAQAGAHQGLDAAWVERHLAQARKQETVRRLIMPPPAGTAKNWAAYRARFIEPQRVAAGLAFWRTNQRWLDLAEARWGVPPGIVGSRDRKATKLIADSGGFQFIGAPHLFTAHSTVFAYLGWAETHADVAMTMDIPTRAIGKGRWNSFQACSSICPISSRRARRASARQQGCQRA